MLILLNQKSAVIAVVQTFGLHLGVGCVENAIPLMNKCSKNGGKRQMKNKNETITFDIGLACELGLNASIFLAKLCAEIEQSKIEIDGKKWIPNDFGKMQIDWFPFWSEGTINRLLKDLSGAGFIEKRPFKKIRGCNNVITVNFDKVELAIKGVSQR